MGVACWRFPDVITQECGLTTKNCAYNAPPILLIHIPVKFGVDCSNGVTCIVNITDKQTDKQTDRQTVRRTYLPKLKILASNEKAIRDCVLAKIY